MTKQRVILSTTHVDRHFVQMTKEALEDGAEQINSGGRLVLTVEHDITIPPFGKGVKAWVEARDDGEHQLVVENEWFEEILWAELADGTRLFSKRVRVTVIPLRIPIRDYRMTHFFLTTWSISIMGKMSNRLLGTSKAKLT